MGLAGAICSPVIVRSQESLPVVGVVGSASLSSYGPYMTGFFEGLREAGFVARRNAIVEQRWADGNYDRVRELAAE
jgi:putative ABC transport system substrate-binding protein